MSRVESSAFRVTRRACISFATNSCFVIFLICVNRSSTHYGRCWCIYNVFLQGCQGCKPTHHAHIICLVIWKLKQRESIEGRTFKHMLYSFIHICEFSQFILFLESALTRHRRPAPAHQASIQSREKGGTVTGGVTVIQIMVP